MSLLASLVFVFSYNNMKTKVACSTLDSFDVYKQRFGRVYKSSNDEYWHKNTFMENLKEVIALNSKRNNTRFVLNRYSDLSEKDIGERYAVTMKPYDRIEMDTKSIHRIGNNDYITDEDNKQLYDLTKTDEVYLKYLQKYGKQEFSSEYERIEHYYRFLKSLVDINRNIVKGTGIQVLDENADVLKEPFEYFY